MNEINRRRFLSVCAAALAAGSVLSLEGIAAAGPTTAPRRPNIVLIVADDLGYADLSCQGSGDLKTPNIDSIARNGARFTDGYCVSPLCAPSRAGMLTGRYPQRFGIEFNGGQKATPDGPPFGLPAGERTLAEMLKPAGYATGLIGKWHLGSRDEFRPTRRGFDEFFGFLEGGHSYVDAKADPHNPIRRADAKGEQRVEEAEYLTDAFTREALSFIDRHAGEPFFLDLAYNAVHVPMDSPPKKYLDRYASISDPGRRTLAGMMAAVDDGVGAVLQKLRDLGLEQNTLVILVSDNGAPTKANFSHNDPFRGFKSHVYEGGIRIAFMAQWKGAIPPGSVLRQPAILMDIFPTALSAAGVSPAPGVKLDGVDLLPLLKRQTDARPHEALCWRLGNTAACRQADWKIFREDVKDKWSLFDLSRDPGEQDNLARRHPEKVRDLQAIYAAWESQTIKPLWIGTGRRDE